MITKLFSKREERYLSWEEYKKKLIEIQVIQLIERFMKQDSNFGYGDLNDIKISRLGKIGGGEDERNIFE